MKTTKILKYFIAIVLAIFLIIIVIVSILINNRKSDITEYQVEYIDSVEKEQRTLIYCIEEDTDTSYNYILNPEIFAETCLSVDAMETLGDEINNFLQSLGYQGEALVISTLVESSPMKLSFLFNVKNQTYHCDYEYINNSFNFY